MIRYSARGKVRGECWSGGICYFNSIEITGVETKEGLIEKINERYRNGTIYNGNEFRRIVGVLIEIEEIDTIEYNGKDYSHSEYELYEIGDIPDDDYDMLIFKLL